MAYPDTVVVNADGDLLVGLSDGQIVNAGSVRGPAGYMGDRGAAGLRGEPGISCIAAFKAPSQDDGREGDSWIDCSSAEFAFYKRSGNGWNKIANLRQPAPDRRMGVAGGGGGSSSGGGSGGGAQVHVGPNQPAFPSEGDLWFDTDDADGRLYVYANGTWQPVLPQADLDGYAKNTYVDAKTAPLPYLIETDKNLREGKASPRSGVAEIQLVDAEDNFSNVKFTGTGGIGVSSDLQGIIIDGSLLSGDITAELNNFATKIYSDAGDEALQNQIDDLEVQKGSAANYDCKATSGSFNARPGEFGTDNATASSVTMLGIGQEDKSGQLTKTINVGDIIELVGPDGSDTRFKVTDATGAPVLMAVVFVSGDQGFVLDQQYTVYIYPQNEAGATKAYVDAQDGLRVEKAGGTMTGALVLNNGSGFDTSLEVKAYDSSEPGQRKTTLTIGADGKLTTKHLVKTTRNQGYAFEVKPDDASTISYVHTNGTFAFGGKGTINGNLDITTESSEGVRVLGNFKVKAKDQTIGGTNCFEVFNDKGHYNGLITQDNDLVNKKYVDDHAGGGVVVYNGTTPPSGEARGTMLLTNANALYIYV